MRLSADLSYQIKDLKSEPKGTKLFRGLSDKVDMAEEVEKKQGGSWKNKRSRYFRKPTKKSKG